MPSFSPDGEWVYFIREGTGKGLFPVERPAAAGTTSRPRSSSASRPTARASRRASSTAGSRTAGRSWFFWMRQPVLSPDGHTIAVVSDGPDPRAERRRHPVLRHEDEEVHEAQARPSRGARPPGPGVDARTGATSCSSRTAATAAAARPRSSSTTRRTRRSFTDHRARATSRRRRRPTASTSRRRRPTASGPTS